jgi:hypothetical protein
MRAVPHAVPGRTVKNRTPSLPRPALEIRPPSRYRVVTMPTDVTDVAQAERDIAELVSVSLDAFIEEVQDPRLRQLIRDVPAIIRAARLGENQEHGPVRTAMRRLEDFATATTHHAPALAAEAAAFREALAVLLDDLDE